MEDLVLTKLDVYVFTTATGKAFVVSAKARDAFVKDPPEQMLNVVCTEYGPCPFVIHKSEVL